MGNHLKQILVLTICIMFSTSLLAQEKTITGTVTDPNNLPLPGVNVIVEGTSRGTQTDFDGQFSIMASPGEVLVFSFLGTQTISQTVGAEDNYNIVLEQSNASLDEVVVVGYGTQKARNVTSAVTQLNAETFEDRPISTVDEAFSGQMAGVQTRRTSGEPGQALEVIVRGGASISAGNEPLYILDGVPVANLGNLNPQDIASIEVLKDAASAAIYGSRGSNGVVIVTTQRGVSGRPTFQVDAFYGVQQIEKKLDMASPEEWIETARTAIDENWVELGRQNGLDYSASDPVEFRQEQLGVLQNTGLIPDPRWETGEVDFIDWQDEFYRIAPIQQYQISASGGGDRFNYYISGNYLNQEGIVINSNFERFSFRANLETDLNESIRMGMNLSPSMSWTNGGNVTGKDQRANRILQMAPVAEPGVGINTGAFGNEPYAWAGSYTSPVAYQLNALNTTARQRIVSSLYLDADIFEGLNFRVTGAWNSDVADTKDYAPGSVQRRHQNQPEGALSSGGYSTARQQRYMLESLLSYNKSYGEHNLSALLGYSAEKFENRYSNQSHSNFPNDLLTILDHNTSTVNASQTSEDEQALIGYFGRINYNYQEKYLLGASIRTDGSSKFGRNNRWGTFPAFSLGWRISDESFMEPLNFLSNFLLRYSWGMTGSNAIPNYVAYANAGVFNYTFGNQLAVGYGPNSIANPNLGWEKAESSNYGVDISFFNNRILFSADYYIKNTTDLLLSVPLALSTGFERGWQNIGAVENKGLELELTSHNFTGDFSWRSSLNMAANRNKVLKLGTGDAPIYAGFNNSTAIIKVGEPLMSFFMYDAIGVYMNEEDLANSPRMDQNIVGDVKYRDVNGDGVITPEDRTIVGNRNPSFTWGFSNNFSYKNLDLSILLMGQEGNHIYSILGRSIDRPGMGTSANHLGRWRDRWRSPENPGDGATPRIDGTTGSFYDTRWLYDASYIRVKNVTLGYNTPEGAINFMDSARIYLSAENLFIWHDYYGGYSPEAENNEGGDYGGYPTSRTFTLGLQLSF